MKIRRYRTSDCSEMEKLFYDTVRAINAKDYTKAQLDVWATGNVDLESWNNSFLEHITFVVEDNGLIVGFGDMNHIGYLDRLYVHKDYQGNGVATAIVEVLESELMLRNITSLTTHASITARTFFEKRGFKMVKENIVVRCGVEMSNYEMVKYV